MRRRKIKGADERLISYEGYVVNGMFNMLPPKNIDNNCTDFDYRNIENNWDYLNIKDNYRGKWNKIFGNNNPIYIELGSGRGKFITGMASKYPNINFIALEVKEEVLLRGVEKAEAQNLKNVRFIWGQVELLDEYFEDGELDRIFINFCDPWSKKKYAKRRLTYHKFLNLYRKKLNVEHPEIHFKTDNRELFDFSFDEFLDYGWSIKNVSFDLLNSNWENNVTTEYEEKFNSLNMPIHRLEARYRHE